MHGRSVAGLPAGIQSNFNWAGGRLIMSIVV